MSEFPIELAGAGASTLMWARPGEIEFAAQDQLRRVSQLPWTHGVRVMPDVHVGKGATVGSVIAMKNAVAPSAVGVDIGCGVEGVRTSISAKRLPDDLRKLRLAIEKVVPVGFNAHKDAPKPIDHRLKQQHKNLLDHFDALHADVMDLRHRAVHQCGTLGSGNHFIELCSDDDGMVWITLHSGSRNIGNQIAQWHIHQARGLEHNLGLPDRDLAVFLSSTDEMTKYMHDLYWAQEYAAVNRRVMLELVMGVLRDEFPSIEFADHICCHHNYVAEETYDDVDVIVTRKGAIHAGSGELGIIPGSMATGSYVVRGLGNLAAYCSASHGAGRRLSRSAAKRKYTVEDVEKQTKGIECRKDAGIIDEIPRAYKDINQVMADQSDLVDVVARLTTLLCIKG